MNRKNLHILTILMLLSGSISIASAQELGRKNTRQARYVVGLSIGNRSYLESDFFTNHPDGIVPADLRGNSYSVLFESIPSPGYFGVELRLSADESRTESPQTGNEHRLRPYTARLSGKIHPLANTGLSHYLDLYIGGGATGVAFNYETTGIQTRSMRDSYKAFGPHAMAGFEYYLGTFSSGKWRWGAYVDYIFTSVNVERVRRNPTDLADRPDFNAGGHLFTFGVKFSALR
jgi:hypothetical protein